MDEETEFYAEFDAVVETDGQEKALTSRVRETCTGIVHYVYLRGPVSRRRLANITGPAPVPGETVRISFTAVEAPAAATDGRLGMVGNCSRVKDRDSYVHYLDLSSPNVRQSGQQPEPGGRIVWRRVS